MSEKQKNPGGRPKKYTDEVLSELAKSLREWVKNLADKNKFDMLKRWCFDNDFNPKYFARYAEVNEEFKEAYEWAKEWQEYIISYGALNQSLNARFAQFFLGCNHNWKTKEAGDDRLGVLANDFGRFLEYMDSQKNIDHEDEE